MKLLIQSETQYNSVEIISANICVKISANICVKKSADICVKISANICVKNLRTPA